MCVLPGTTSGTFFIVSMTPSQVPNCLASSSGKPVFSNTTDATCLWRIVKDVDGGLYLNNYADDTLLVINTDGSLALVANPVTMKDMTPGAMRLVLATPPAASTTPTATYVQAAYAQNPLLSPALVMFKRGTFTVYDTQHQKTLLYPANTADHSWFQKLPSAFQSPDACIQNQNSEVFLFKGSSWLLWDTTLGDYAASFTERAPQRMGPGGHAFFAQLPPPFCKGIQGGYKLDASSVVLVSGSLSISWDMGGHKAKAAPVQLSTLLSGMPQDTLSSMSTLVEDPLNFGSLFLFSQGSYTLYDAVNQRLLQAPAPLGPDGSVFQTLVSPFVPSLAGDLSAVQRHHHGEHRLPCGRLRRRPEQPIPLAQDLHVLATGMRFGERRVQHSRQFLWQLHFCRSDSAAQRRPVHQTAVPQQVPQ